MLNEELWTFFYVKMANQFDRTTKIVKKKYSSIQTYHSN